MEFNFLRTWNSETIRRFLTCISGIALIISLIILLLVILLNREIFSVLVLVVLIIGIFSYNQAWHFGQRKGIEKISEKGVPLYEQKPEVRTKDYVVDPEKIEEEKLKRFGD